MKNPGAKAISLRVIIFAVMVLAWQSSSAGLGLGEARIDSFLGQTLQVRIGLLQPSEQALDSLSVEVASAEDHARLGVPTEALALGLRVELDRSLSPPLLQLRSTRPVNDPFVQVLISARWAGGRMLREYTLFLDPPTAPVAPPVRRTTAPAAQEPFAPERREAPAPTPAPPQPQAAAATAEVPAPRRAEPATRTETVGPVRAGQTLWSIAEAWRPDESLSMNQVLMAILERNPEAFIDNNVNRLRRGAELVMPDVASVRAITPNEALRRIQAQNAAWQRERAAVIVAVPSSPARPVDERTADDQRRVSEVAEPAPEAPETTLPVSEVEAVQTLPEVEAIPEPAPEAAADSARLALTAADDELLIDQQAIGVERERLERRLDELQRQVRSDGLEAPEIEARIDQIRQAIASNDAGGMMVASEGLALLEQQMRDARLARDRLVREAAPTPAAPEPAEPAPVEPVPAAPAPATDRTAWLQLAAAALALLLVIALAWTIFRRRRTRSEEDLEPRPGVGPVAAATVTPEPASDPFDARLAELYRFAESEDHVAFGSAFSDFHAKLETTDDPRWREAVRLARILVPGHPLLLNDSDADDRPNDEQWSDEVADRDLEDLLAEMEVDPGEPERTVSRADEGSSDLASLLDSQDDASDGEDSPDLARLANRLDPEDEAPGFKEQSTIEDDEAEALFREEEPLVPSWAQEQDDEPLNLDFEFSSRPRDEAGEPELSEDEPESTRQGFPPGHEDAEPGLELRSNPSEDEELEAQTQWFDLNAEADAEMAALSLDDAGDPEDDAPVLSDDDAEVKLDLARAYLSMDDKDSARALLEEILDEGSSAHQAQARALLDDLD